MDVVSCSEVLSPQQKDKLPKVGAAMVAGSFDLLKSAVHELDFLQYIDSHPELYYHENFVSYAIIRYEKYWMPLLAKVSEKMADDLRYVAPMDVHWVWHVHMLAPVQYNKDCTATVDRMLGHEPMPLELMSQ